MEQFVLVLITLNAITGELVAMTRDSHSHDSARSCLAAAAESGPQRSSGALVRMFTCQVESGEESGSASEDDMARTARVPAGTMVISGDSREAYLSFR